MNKERKSHHVIDRRTFLKKLNAAASVVGITSLTGCASDKASAPASTTETSAKKKEGGMTYRTTPTTGDKVSLLGYGCLRWFSVVDKETGKIDQEGVNRLVDYAIEHGVNYFDTAPVYCNGECERVTGIALNRHPRDKWYIAAKISNLEKHQWSREETLKMYENSFKELQVDYIDYMLLHGIGMGGMEELEGRFLNNGVLDHLLEERKKGRIRNLGFSFHGDVKIFDHLLKLHDEGKYTWDMVQIQLNYIDWRHAQEEHARNINAEYLYGELAKRNIPAVIMEPLLGGRLANVHDHIAAILKQRRPDLSIASWAFRFAGTHPHVLEGEHRDVLSTRTIDTRRHGLPRLYGPEVRALSAHSMQRLQVLHALSVWHRHSGSPHPLQQMCERRPYAGGPSRPEVSRIPKSFPHRLRPFRAQTPSGKPLYRMRAVRTQVSATHQHCAPTAACGPFCGRLEAGTRF